MPLGAVFQAGDGQLGWFVLETPGCVFIDAHAETGSISPMELAVLIVAIDGEHLVAWTRM
jgi:uncharacterized protein (AIM24 family)